MSFNHGVVNCITFLFNRQLDVSGRNTAGQMQDALGGADDNSPIRKLVNDDAAASGQLHSSTVALWNGDLSLTGKVGMKHSSGMIDISVILHES